MTPSSIGTHVRGFWEYFWAYAETHVGVYRAATAMAAVFGLLMYFDPLFALPAIAAYLLPPMYLYHVEGDSESANIPKTTEDSQRDTDTDFDGPDIDADGDDFDADFDGSDADADADGADADADADGADVDIDN